MRDLLLLRFPVDCLPLGPALVLTIAFLIVLTYQKKRSRRRWSEHRGLRTLIWMPILYCIALVPLEFIDSTICFGLHELFNRSQAIEASDDALRFPRDHRPGRHVFDLAMKTTHVRRRVACCPPSSSFH